MFLSTQLSAQNLYVFSVIETNNAARPDRLADHETFNRMINDLAKYANLTKYHFDFGDSANYTPQTIRLTLQNLKQNLSDKDVVWFHYSGLGFNDGDRAYPTMQLNGGSMAMREVISTLRGKLPRTLIISADCGNKEKAVELISNQVDNTNRPVYAKVKIIPRALAPRVSFVGLSEMPSIKVVENYKALFFPAKTRQVIIMTSSSKGQASFSDSIRGSLWLQAIENTLTDETRNGAKTADWSAIRELAIKNTSALSDNKQIPIINIQKDNCCFNEEDN